jgi:nicotinamidase/pyrazinamidase
MTKTALIVVDVQKDFCEGGALSAADTLSLLEPLRKQVEEARQKGALIVYTRDWHPKNHSSFRSQGGPWPVHCVADTNGAQLMPPLEAQKEDVIVNKGVSTDGAGYSGFEDTGLAKQLRDAGVDKVGVTGIATEYCVRATALDSVQARFDTTVLSDLIRAVNPSATEKILAELKQSNVRVSTSEEWLASL